MRNIYVIGSLRNPNVQFVAKELRRAGHAVFDDWQAAGEGADDAWQAYETTRGRSYGEALKGHAAKNVYAFDTKHLLSADTVVMVMPAGKSGHLEFGHARGRGVEGFILFDQEPERWDVMYQFASGVFFDLNTLLKAL